MGCAPPVPGYMYAAIPPFLGFAPDRPARRGTRARAGAERALAGRRARRSTAGPAFSGRSESFPRPPSSTNQNQNQSFIHGFIHGFIGMRQSILGTSTISQTWALQCVLRARSMMALRYCVTAY